MHSLAVRDNVIVFDVDEKFNIFRVFYVYIHGTGLRVREWGLHPAKKIAARHGNLIEADGKPGFVFSMSICLNEELISSVQIIVTREPHSRCLIFLTRMLTVYESTKETKVLDQCVMGHCKRFREWLYR